MGRAERLGLRTKLPLVPQIIITVIRTVTKQDSACAQSNFSFFLCLLSPPPSPAPLASRARCAGLKLGRNTSRRALSILQVTWPEPPHTPYPHGARLSPLPRGCSQPLLPAAQPGPGGPRAPQRLPTIVPGAASCSPRRRRWLPGRAGWERDPPTHPSRPHHHHRHGRLSLRERRPERR